MAVNEDSISVALNYFKDNIELPSRVNGAVKLMQSSGAPHFGGTSYQVSKVATFFNMETPNPMFKDSLNQRSFDILGA